MKTMLNGTPTWPRLILAGLMWGVVCGAGAGALTVLALVSDGFTNDGFYWEGPTDFVLGVALYGAMACMYGAVIGGGLGLVSGLVAGLVLAVMLRLTRPDPAALNTVVIVVTAQITIAVLLADTWAWFVFIVPIVGIIPLTISSLAAARDWADRVVSAQRHDTLAA